MGRSAPRTDARLVAGTSETGLAAGETAHEGALRVAVSCPTRRSASQSVAGEAQPQASAWMIEKVSTVSSAITTIWPTGSERWAIRALDSGANIRGRIAILRPRSRCPSPAAFGTRPQPPITAQCPTSRSELCRAVRIRLHGYRRCISRYSARSAAICGTTASTIDPSPSTHNSRPGPCRGDTNGSQRMDPVELTIAIDDRLAQCATQALRRTIPSLSTSFANLTTRARRAATSTSSESVSRSTCSFSGEVRTTTRWSRHVPLTAARNSTASRNSSRSRRPRAAASATNDALSRTRLQFC